MAGTIRENKTILIAEDRTAGAYASMVANLRAAQASVTSLQAGLAGLVGGGIVGGFALMVKHSLDYAESINKAAQKTGLAAEEFSQLAYAAKLADVSNESLAKGFKGLSEMMVKASDATSYQSAVMKRLGVDLAGGTGPALEKIADYFAKLPDGATKTALAVDLFGKAGQDMIPMLNQGGDGLRKMKEEAADLGLTISGQVAADAERFNDNLKAMATGAQRTGTALVTGMAASLADVSAAMKEAYKDAGALRAIIVGLGGVGAKIFTDDSLTAIEKSQKRINELTTDLLQLRQRMIDIQDIQAPWADNMRKGMIESAKNGTLELARLNKELAELYGHEERLAQQAKDKAAAQKAKEDEARLAKEKFDADKKAAEEIKRWNEQMRKLDAQGWVAYVEALTAEYEAELKEQARITEDYYKDKERLQDLDTKGWIAKIEADQAEYEDSLRLMAKITEDFYKERDKDLEKQARAWEELADMGGRFFSDLVMNGRSAFDRLRDSLKSFVADLVALFAKKWILNIAGNLIGGPIGQTLLGSAASAGSGTLAGALSGGPLGSALGMGAAIAALGGGLGYGGAAALGAGDRGQKVGGITGALFGGLVGAIIGKLTDPDGLAQRQGWFGDSSMGGDTRTRGSSIFGGFGITKSQWFGDDMIDQLKKFMDGLGTAENRLAQFLSPAEIAKVQAAFAGVDKQYGFGTEHGDFSGALGQILKDRVDAIINAVDPSLHKWIDSFEGSGDQLLAYAEQLIQIRKMLSDGSFAEVMKSIPDLTIDGLTRMQQAGETLAQTFDRVVGEFINAQNALNAAIASRNPTFARELVLGQRNNIATQFAQQLGLNFGEPLLQQMALNPQSFHGLSTNQMQLLAQFLTLQTQLEQLDAQLAQGTQNITVSLGNFDTAIGNTVNLLLQAQGNLAGYLQGSLLSDLSPLTPMQQYSEARSQYLANLAQAQAGDPDAINAFGGYRDNFLRLSRSIYASSGQYNADYFSTFNQGASLTGGQVQPLTTLAYQQGVQQMVTTMAGVVSALGDTIKVQDDEVRAELADVKAMLNRISTGALTNTAGALA